MNISIHSIIEPLQSIGGDLISFFPKIIAAFAVIIAGIIIS